MGGPYPGSHTYQTMRRGLIGDDPPPSCGCRTFGRATRTDRRRRLAAALLAAALLAALLTAAAWLASVASLPRLTPRAVWQRDVLHYALTRSLADVLALALLRGLSSAALQAHTHPLTAS